MDDKPFNSTLVMTLCAQPKAVARSSHTLIPVLLLPLAQVIGGVVAITFREGVGEGGVVWTDGVRTAVSALSSPSFLFFESEVKLARSSFFKFLMRAYLSLLYQVAISAKRKRRRKREGATPNQTINEIKKNKAIDR